MELKRTFRTQAVRDLAWALRSPMLMTHECTVDEGWGQAEADRYRGLLAKLDEPGSSLASEVRHQSSNSLGGYFETLMTTWIDEVPPARLLASNWQAWGGKGTVGEYDLIFSRDGVIHHWELAIKFYLGHRDAYGQSRWSGPNPEDRLDRKWAKMRGQQLRLSSHPAGRGALRALGIHDEVISRAFIKGYLFESLNEEHWAEPAVDANPDGLRGWWVHRGELSKMEERLDPQGDLRWLPLSTLRWMSPVELGDDDRTFAFAHLDERLYRGQYALLAGLRETKRGFREVTRGFVVPDQWPLNT